MEFLVRGKGAIKLLIGTLSSSLATLLPRTFAHSLSSRYSFLQHLPPPAPLDDCTVGCACHVQRTHSSTVFNEQEKVA